MKKLSNREEKIRTTLYLTKENRRKLDMIPKGQKTELMNYAIAKVLSELEREKLKQGLLESLSVPNTAKKAEVSTQDALQLIRKRELGNLQGANFDTGH